MILCFASPSGTRVCAGGCSQCRGKGPGQQVPSTGLELQPPQRRHDRYLHDLLACIIYWQRDPNSLYYLEDARVVKYSGVAAVKRCSQQLGISLTSSGFQCWASFSYKPRAWVEARWVTGHCVLLVERGSVCESGSFCLLVLTFPREEPTSDFMDIQKDSQLPLKTGVSQRFVPLWLDCTSGRKMTFFIVTWPHAQCACVSQAKGLYSRG